MCKIKAAPPPPFPSLLRVLCLLDLLIIQSSNNHTHTHTQAYTQAYALAARTQIKHSFSWCFVAQIAVKNVTRRRGTVFTHTLGDK